VGAVAVGVVLVMLGAAAVGLGWFRIAGPAEPSRSVDDIGILVAPPPPESMLESVGCAPEGLTGTLQVDEGTGLTIDGAVVVWPTGFGARRDDGAAILLDAAGQPAARSGDTLRISGGFPDQRGRFWVCGPVVVVRRGG
jgi:hypothetical protein